MKGFVLGVIGTVLAGIVLFLAQDWYSSQKIANQKSVNVTINDDIASFDSAKLAALSKKINVKDARLVSATIKNIGSQPLMGAKVHFGSSIGGGTTIFDTGIVPDDQSDSETVNVNSSKSGFDVEIRSLLPGKKHTVWVIYRCCEIFSAAPLTENLQVTQKVSDFGDIEQLEEDGWFWLSVGITAAISFVVGIVLDSSINASMLKARGYDLQAIIKKPPNAPGE